MKHLAAIAIALTFFGAGPALAQQSQPAAEAEKPAAEAEKPAAESAAPAAEADKPAEPIIWRTTCICSDGGPTVTAKILITEGNLAKVKEFFEARNWDNGKEVWFYGVCADAALCTPKKTEEWGDVATAPVSGPMKVSLSARRNLPSPGNEAPGRVFELDGWVLEKP